ncbi:glutathione S-transferase family protein [Conexibacter sp. SYSU D00693]|uniref:glutathione S-transferase family protein n=1 Tax=Conexibacter sp. SYSU D00693 TaxID=2812560 RepID=UPI00196AC073|nr:glutathione S-transferase family protein [Conexibacter sp. SYSU D00693]
MSKAAAAFPRESDDEGRFVRQESAFRDQVWDRPAPGRYHLYVCKACPWAHRTMIVRELKGLGDVLAMTTVDPIRDERGWRFSEDAPDPLHGWSLLSEAYTATDPSFDARVTVPVLWDTEEGRVVNNESAEVLRMLNAWSDEGPDLLPDDLREEVEEVEDRVYDRVNNGVYKCGFASTQEAYEEAFDPLFAELDALDARLADSRYLVGGRLTEADVRLYTTLVRFDAVYFGHFKCNARRITDFPNLGPYLRDLFQHPGFGSTTDFDHIKRHYYVTHTSINPTQIVPKGPVLDLDAPHDRDRLGPRTV